jgi:hypothetical protein
MTRVDAWDNIPIEGFLEDIEIRRGVFEDV